MEIQFDKEKLLAAVDRFPKCRLLVIGDLMLDEFIWGKVERISPEAPVPVVEVTKETRLLGGAANVINNIASVGGRAMVAGVVGDDGPGREVAAMVRELGVSDEGILFDSERPTTRKTRVVAQSQQVVRFDRERRKPLDHAVFHRLIRFMTDIAAEIDAVIISDYGKGLVTEELMEAVRKVFAAKGRVVAVDPKVNNFHLYRGVTVITPNHHEAALGAAMVVETEDDLIAAGRKLIRDLSCRSVLITRGEQGMTLFEGEREPRHIPTVARKVFDVTGAGDTVIAILTLGLAAGLELDEASVLANYAAGVVVGEIGTSAVTAAKLKRTTAEGFSPVVVKTE